MASATPATRDLLLAAAKRLFAERGFYGASIAAIAEDLDITKQALLHHFGSKERLYGEVLKQISERYEHVVATVESEASVPEDALEHFFATFYSDAIRHADETRLLLRELLDNRDRAGTAETWYLKPFLDSLTALAKRTSWGERVDEPEIQATIYQLLGSAVYFAVSEPTLRSMYGRKPYTDLQKAFPDAFQRLVRAAFQPVDR